MNEALAYLADLTPIGAVLVLASIAAVILTQAAKQRQWSKQRTQTVAAIIAAVLGLLAAVVLGLIAGIPDSVIQIVSSVLLSIAAVAVLAKVLYGVLGYVIPDGRPAADPATEQASTNLRIDAAEMTADDLRNRVDALAARSGSDAGA